MIIKKESMAISVTTILTSLLFCAIYSFKLGESIFYDYPSYYIYLNFQDVINYSLKALWFYGFFIMGAVVIRIQWYPRIALMILFLAAIINKIVKMFMLYHSGNGSALGYMNVGTILILVVLLAHFLNKSFVFSQGRVKIYSGYSVVGIVCFLLLNIFIGLNYHSVFPNSTWQTVDGKVLVGTYKDSLILRECKAGKSFFYLQEPKDQKFTMIESDTSGVLGLRCLQQ